MYECDLLGMHKDSSEKGLKLGQVFADAILPVGVANLLTVDQ